MAYLVKIPKHLRKEQHEAKKVSKSLKPRQVFFMGSGQLCKANILVFLDIKELYLVASVCSQLRLLAFDCKVLLCLSRRLDDRRYDGFVSDNATEMATWIRDRYRDQRERIQKLETRRKKAKMQELAQLKKS